MLRCRNYELPNVRNDSFVEYFALMKQIIFQVFVFVCFVIGRQR